MNPDITDKPECPQPSPGAAGSALLKPQVWSFGGGTQSCAIAALVIQGRLPKPDLIVIADTGRECSETWKYLNQVVNPALKEVGLKVDRVLSVALSYSGINLWDASGNLQLPVFSTDGDGDSKLANYCSSAWKRDVIKRYMSEEWRLTRSQYVLWLGYGREEQLRWVKCMNGKDYRGGIVRLPLVTDVPMNRHECQCLIKKMGWPTPAPRSRCWMCPNQSNDEWRSLPSEEFQKAVRMEAEIRQRDEHAWLHRSCVPLDKVDLSAPDDLFTIPCDSGQCFV